MSEKGFLESRQTEITAERLLRHESDEIRKICVKLIQEFGFFYDPDGYEDEESGAFRLPAAEWSYENKQELFELQLRDELGEEILEHEVKILHKDARYMRVARIDVVYYPEKLDGTSNNDRPITIASIEPWAGADGEAEVYDFSGEALSLEDTQALHNDIKRYGELLEQGKTERTH